LPDTLDPARSCNFTVERHVFDYTDPHIDADFEYITEEVAVLTAMAADYYGPSATGRKRTSSIDFGNPATARLIVSAPTVKTWLGLIPSAAALHPIYEPEADAYVSGEAICEPIRPWFRNLADAHGIRSRAAIMKQVLSAAARQSDTSQRWLSLACGAAQPLFETMEGLRSEGATTPHATLADLDTSALGLARNYARSHGLEQNISIAKMNVLHRRGIRPRGASIGIADWSERFDVVDAVGLLEYLKPDDWLYTYSGLITSKRRMAGAVTFLRNAFSCVRQGGQLVVGNMLDTHPQRDFILNVAQWPHVQPRSIDAMLQIFADAGLSGHLDIYTPTDGVYALYVIQK